MCVRKKNKRNFRNFRIFSTRRVECDAQCRQPVSGKKKKKKKKVFKNIQKFVSDIYYFLSRSVMKFVLWNLACLHIFFFLGGKFYLRISIHAAV